MQEPDGKFNKRVLASYPQSICMGLIGVLYFFFVFSFLPARLESVMRVVIVGGVAGGAGTAARLRRLDEKAEIILIERGANIS